MGPFSPSTFCAYRRTRFYLGGETGLQWLPLQVPGNVRIIVTATNPDPDYLNLHEQKVRQHMFSQPSGSIGGGTGSGCAGSAAGRGQHNAETEGQREAEYESSHRRRKVSRLLKLRDPRQEAGNAFCASNPIPFCGILVSRMW